VPGTFACTIVAVDTFPDPVTIASKAFTLVVESAPQCIQPAITSGVPPPGAVGTSYAFTVSAGGSPAPVLEVAGLPAGLVFDAASGAISGTPESAGISTLTITATNGCVSPAVQTQTLTVDRAPTTLSLVALPEVAIFGQTVTATLAVEGGPPVPQGTVQLCVRGTGAFCGPPFDTVPPGTPPEKIVAPLSRTLDPGGRADFRLTGLIIDDFALSAIYAGDASHVPASAGPIDELVIKGVLLPAPPGGKAFIAATAQASAIPALSSIGIVLLSAVVATIALATLRRRARR
jgi:hypothetical protein